MSQMFQRLADSIRGASSVGPDFDLAVSRHRLLDTIQKASDTGQRQVLG